MNGIYVSKCFYNLTPEEIVLGRLVKICVSFTVDGFDRFGIVDLISLLWLKFGRDLNKFVVSFDVCLVF